MSNRSGSKGRLQHKTSCRSWGEGRDYTDDSTEPLWLPSHPIPVLDTKGFSLFCNGPAAFSSFVQTNVGTFSWTSVFSIFLTSSVHCCLQRPCPCAFHVSPTMALVECYLYCRLMASLRTIRCVEDISGTRIIVHLFPFNIRASSANKV